MLREKGIRMMKLKKQDCPNCGARESMVPIIYGAPSEENLAAQQRGEIFIARDMPRLDSPDIKCTICGHEDVSRGEDDLSGLFRQQGF
mgnify:CR=1 FL=1